MRSAPTSSGCLPVNYLMCRSVRRRNISSWTLPDRLARRMLLERFPEGDGPTQRRIEGDQNVSLSTGRQPPGQKAPGVSVSCVDLADPYGVSQFSEGDAHVAWIRRAVDANKIHGRPTVTMSSGSYLDHSQTDTPNEAETDSTERGKAITVCHACRAQKSHPCCCRASKTHGVGRRGHRKRLAPSATGSR